MNQRTVFSVLLTVSVLGTSCAFATAAPIVNSDFESPSTGADGNVPGFVVDQGYAVILDDGPPHDQVLDLNVYQNDPSNPQAQVEQVLASTFAEGAYSFTADVDSVYNYQGYQGGFTVSLFDNRLGTTLGSGTFVPTDSNWATLSFTASIPAGSQSIGDPIALIIAHTATGDAQIDNLALDFAAVPEPNTWAFLLVGFGLAGLAVRGARRDLSLSHHKRCAWRTPRSGRSRPPRG